MTKRYSEEFRLEAVRLVLESKSSLPQIARDLGVNVWTLKGWVKDHRADAGMGKAGRPESIEEENERLKRELSVLRQERDLLKKAAAYFAKEQL